MQYYSPFHLIPTDLIQGNLLDKKALKKAKKRLLAEFELLGTTTILLKEREVDKNTVLKIFEQLESDRQAKYHLRLYQEPDLLDFLENGNIKVFQDVDRLEILFLEHDFFKFIEPYFIERYNIALYQAIRTEDIDLVEQICDISGVPDISQESTAYQKTYRYFKGRIRDLHEIRVRTRKEHIPDKEILPFVSFNQIDLWNSLPDYFESPRNEYALELEDLALHLHNSHRRSTLAVFALEQGMALDISEETRSRLDYLWKQIKDNATTVKESDLEEQKDDTRVFWTAFVVIKVVLILMSLLS